MSDHLPPIKSDPQTERGPFRLDTWNGQNWIVSSGWLSKDDVFDKLLEASVAGRACRISESCLPIGS